MSFPTTAHELAHLLMEESAEVAQAASKVIRFGPESRKPEDPSSSTNRERLEEELGDLMALMVLLSRAGVIRLPLVQAAVRRKFARVAPYLSPEARYLLPRGPQ